MKKIETIPKAINGYSIENIGNGRRNICKDNIIFINNIVDMNIYEEATDFWIIAKTFNEVVILKICDIGILFLLAVKGKKFDSNTQVQFLHNNRYLSWNISDLEYIENETSMNLREDAKISCFVSSKISECKIKTLKKIPPN